MSIDTSVQPLAGALEALRSKTDPTSWIILHYSPPQSSTISFHSSGSDPALDSVRDAIDTGSATSAGPNGAVAPGGAVDDVMFAYALIERKGLIVVFLKDTVGGVRRARAIVHSRAVAALFPDYYALVTIAHPSQLTDDLVRERLALDNPLPPLPTETQSATPSASSAAQATAAPLAAPLDPSATSAPPAEEPQTPSQPQVHDLGDDEYNPSLTPPPRRVARLPPSVSDQFAEPDPDAIDFKRHDPVQRSTYDALLANTGSTSSFGATVSGRDQSVVGYENGHVSEYSQAPSAAHTQPEADGVSDLPGAGVASTSHGIAALGLGGSEERRRPSQAFAKLNPFRSISAGHPPAVAQSQVRSVSLNSPTPASPDAEQQFAAMPLPIPPSYSNRSNRVSESDHHVQPPSGITPSSSATTPVSPASPASRFKPSSIASAFRRKKRVSASSIEPTSAPTSPYAGEFGGPVSSDDSAPPPPLPPKEYPTQLQPPASVSQPLTPSSSLNDESVGETDGYVAYIPPNEIVHTSTGGIGYNASASASRSNSASALDKAAVTPGGPGGAGGPQQRGELKPSPSASEALFKARQKSVYEENEMHEKFRRVEEERARARAAAGLIGDSIPGSATGSTHDIGAGAGGGVEAAVNGVGVGVGGETEGGGVNGGHQTEGSDGLAYLHDADGEADESHSVPNHLPDLTPHSGLSGVPGLAVDGATGLAAAAAATMGSAMLIPEDDEAAPPPPSTGAVDAVTITQPASRSSGRETESAGTSVPRSAVEAVAATGGTFPAPPSRSTPSPSGSGPAQPVSEVVLESERIYDQGTVLQPSKLQPTPKGNGVVSNVVAPSSSERVEEIRDLEHEAARGGLTIAPVPEPEPISITSTTLPEPTQAATTAPADALAPVPSPVAAPVPIPSPSPPAPREMTEEERLDAARRTHEAAQAELARMALLERERREAAEQQAKEEERGRRAAVRKGLEESRDAGKVMLTGWATVQTSRSMTWRRRWFKLFPTELHLFKSDVDATKPLVVIPLPGSQLCETYEESQVKGSFKLETTNEEYYMFADSIEDKETILEGLGLCLA